MREKQKISRTSKSVKRVAMQTLLFPDSDCKVKRVFIDCAHKVIYISPEIEAKLAAQRKLVDDRRAAPILYKSSSGSSRKVHGIPCEEI